MTDDLTTLETRLRTLSADDLRREYLALEVDDPRADIYAGELERRNIDV